MTDVSDLWQVTSKVCQAAG